MWQPDQTSNEQTATGTTAVLLVLLCGAELILQQRLCRLQPLYE